MARRGVVGVAWALSAVAAGAAGWWAGATATEPPTVESREPEDLIVTAQSGAVGESLDLGATITWPTASDFDGTVQGTVTSLDLDPAVPARSGDVVATVDLRPVVVAEGDVPAFRTLETGVEGRDVEQLERLFVQQGHLEEADAVFDDRTREAVEAWEEDLGAPEDGIVTPGDLAFIPDLPRPLLSAEGVRVGSVLSPGQPFLAAAAPNPQVLLGVPAEFAADLGEGVEVDVDVEGGGEPLRLVIESVATNPDTGLAEATLAGADGGAVCEDDCADLVPVGGSRLAPARALVVPEVTGTVVPTAALSTRADGAVVVHRDSGEDVQVEVLASSRGRSVVEGIAPGDAVLLLLDDRGGDLAPVQAPPGPAPVPPPDDGSPSAPSAPSSSEGEDSSDGSTSTTEP